MKASNPNISAPLSRKKKKVGGVPLLMGLIIVAVIIFGIVYITVFQGVLGHTKKNPPKEYTGLTLDGYAHPHLDGFERHHGMMNSVDQMRQLEAAMAAYHGTLTLHTDLGDIKIDLRPDWSPSSVNYIHDLAVAGCEQCSFYRAEKPGIFQGKMTSASVTNPNIKGDCPDSDSEKEQHCPEHDPNCACHGPIMRRGFVAWAGGGTGPDFFIDMYEKPAQFWGNQHTAWGRIIDEESLNLVDGIFELPVTKGAGGMHYLEKTIKFTMSTSP